MPPSDAQAFTEAFANLCRKTAPTLKFNVVGPLLLQVETPDGPVSAHLDTVYSICKHDHEGCATFARRIIDAMATGFSSRHAESLSQLRIVVRPSRFLDELSPVGGKTHPIAEPLVGDLWTIAVRDAPTAIVTLGQADLDTLKVDGAAALAAGKHNVESTLGAKFAAGLPKVEPGEGVAGLRGNDYLASLLALPDLWEPLAEKFDGQLYVAAPASDYVIFADARAKGNAAEMARFAAEIAHAAKRPLSTEVFEWTPTGWEAVDLGKAK